MIPKYKLKTPVVYVNSQIKQRHLKSHKSITTGRETSLTRCLPCLSIFSPREGNTTKTFSFRLVVTKVPFFSIPSLYGGFQSKLQTDGWENIRSPSWAALKIIALRLSSWCRWLSRLGLTNGLRTPLISAMFRPITPWSSRSLALGASRVLRIGSRKKALRWRHLVNALSKTIWSC